MVAAGARRRPPAVVGDATHLPMRAASADVVLAAFSFNHLADPAAAFAEAARVARPGGAIAVSTYAADDRHPAKAIVEEELGALGWSTPAWYVDSRARADAFATPDACRRAAVAAGLDATVDRVAVPFPELGPGDLVAWRLGMAHHAPFVRGLSAAARRGVLDRATDRVRAEPSLRRSILVITVRR
jgi:SAM-dependent methyltransferase